ncbi:isoprenyl transferase [Alicyclobacillus macrosporangiidus]|uniref:isoprenyl transferase n=1 Tax=Alicyclobacillus macrosporangiidus TaxID=392015 RepID=UPI00068DE443
MTRGSRRLLKWILGKRIRAQEGKASVEAAGLPGHVAIIMDGNGRWASRRGLPRVAGHRAGMTKVREVIRACDELGIPCLTLYAFSTENWKRPPQEVEYLMRLPEEFFRSEIDELVDRGVRVRFIGDTTQLPPYTQETVRKTLERTRENQGMIVNFALNYGGRADILCAVKAYAREVAAGAASWDDLSEERLDKYLSTAGLPDPDLVIRTSGEIRLSNFLIWQAAYAELWFTDVLWPDFTREHLEQALRDYQRRKRRFGGIK